MNVAYIRLQKELSIISKDHIAGIHILPKGDNLMEWVGYLEGPSDTPYYGGKFNITVSVPIKYPFEPPSVLFTTRIFHPNINDDGKICVDLLKNTWAPSLTIEKLLLSILSLLSSPNADDPLDEYAASMYRNNKTQFDNIAKQYTEQYAK